MTLHDLIDSGIISDDTCITISRRIHCQLIDLRKGNWYHDQILDWLDEEIENLTYDKIGGFSISLTDSNNSTEG